MTRLALSLIETHHITSRKKIAALRKATSQLGLFVLLKSGSPPGVMYIERALAKAPPEVDVMSLSSSSSQQGPEEADQSGLQAVEKFVSIVKGLRYKDYRCVAKPAFLSAEQRKVEGTGLEEVSSLQAFRQEMTLRGVESWWVSKMGFPSSRSSSGNDKG